MAPLAGDSLCTHAACRDAAPVFVDGAAAHPNRPEIEAIYGREITNGCVTNPLRYCPDSTVTNAEMAIFLLRSKEGGSYVPPACPAAPFNDVACTHWAAAWIAEAKKRGIAVGDAFGNFSPGGFVTGPRWRAFSPAPSTSRSGSIRAMNHKTQRRTVRELGGEVFAELRDRFPEEKVRWQVQSEIVDMVMGVLARHVGARIEKDKDLPVEPLSLKAGGLEVVHESEEKFR